MPMPVIFVNYRMREEPGYATLLHRELERQFGADSTFLASQSIRAGDDYVREVFERLRECSVLLAVIGRRWAVTTGMFDWVRREISEALESGLRVVPVLIENAELPAKSDLPTDIAGLTRCQAVRLRHCSFETDISTLVNELRTAIPALRQRAATMMAEGPQVRYALPGTACRIGLIPGSIRRIRHVDVWVNSENTDMQMARHNEFSVSAVIRYWGAARDLTGQVVADLVADELSTAVAGRHPVAPGAAIVTGTGTLAASNNVRRIIHVASVLGEPGAGFRQVRDVGQCVTNALVQAERQAERDPAIRRIVFPLLGTGTATGADVESTAHRMVTTAVDYLAARPGTLLREINFLGYTVAEASILRRVLGARDARPPRTTLRQCDEKIELPRVERILGGAQDRSGS
jgi:hypothetical protein